MQTFVDLLVQVLLAIWFWIHYFKTEIPFMSGVAVYAMSLSMEIFEFILTYVKVNH